jgi:hypothetical protein
MIESEPDVVSCRKYSTQGSDGGVYLASKSPDRLFISASSCGSKARLFSLDRWAMFVKGRFDLQCGQMLGPISIADREVVGTRKIPCAILLFVGTIRTDPLASCPRPGTPRKHP